MKKFNEIGDPNDAKMPLTTKNYVLLLITGHMCQKPQFNL